MKFTTFGWMILFLFSMMPGFAGATVVPTFYIAEKIAKRRASLDTILIQFELLKPILRGAQDKTQSPQVPALWQGSIFFKNGKFIGSKNSDTWPLLALLFEPDPNKLLSAWKNFGLQVSREEDLVNRHSKAESKANSEFDSTFYKHEDNSSVHRYNNSITWQITDSANLKKLQVEKDSFVPLAYQGPCPPEIKSSIWNPDSNEACSVEFHYEINSPMQTPSSIVLKAGDKEILVMKISRAIINPNEKLVRDLAKPTQQEAIDKSDELVGVFYKYFLH